MPSASRALWLQTCISGRYLFRTRSGGRLQTSPRCILTRETGFARQHLSQWLGGVLVFRTRVSDAWFNIAAQAVTFHVLPGVDGCLC